MREFNMLSLIFGLGSIFIGTVGTSIKYVSSEIKEKKEEKQAASVSVAAQVLQHPVSPTIKYSSKPVQEINHAQVATSPISFIGNGGALPEE